MAAYTLKERNGTLYVQWTDPATGKYMRKSTDTKDRKVARQRAPMIMTGQFSVETPLEKTIRERRVTASNMTMAHLFDRCRKTIWSPKRVKSQRTVDSNIRILNGYIGDVAIKDMTYQRLETLVDTLRGVGYAEATIDRKLSAVGAALTQATKELDEDGKPLLTGKPAMPVMSADNFRDRIVSKDEEVAVFKAIEARALREPMRDWRRFGHLCRFLLDTGCRLGEPLALKNARVEEQEVNGTARVSARWTSEETKSGKPKVIWLTKAVIETLPYLRMNAVSDQLFPFKAATAWYMWDTIRSDLKAAGVPMDDVVLHTFRHTCLTRMAKSGKWKLDEISRWAGHATLQITQDRYLHLIPTDTAHLVDRLDAMAAA
jgi:integrase